MWSVPPPPRRPSPRAARLIFRYTGGQAVLLMVGIGFTFFGVLSTALVCHNLPAQLALTFDHAWTQGTVTEAFIDGDVSISDEHPTSVGFRYEVDGQPYVNRSIVLGELPQEFPANREIEIEYVPWRPEWACMKGGMYGFFPMWAAVVSLFPTLGLILLFFAIRSNRRETQAFRKGVLATGYVVSAGPDPTTVINGRHPYRVQWLFSVNGRPFRGQISNEDQDLLPPFEVGSSIPILYLPKNPHANTVWIDPRSG